MEHQIIERVVISFILGMATGAILVCGLELTAQDYRITLHDAPTQLCSECHFQDDLDYWGYRILKEQP